LGLVVFGEMKEGFGFKVGGGGGGGGGGIVGIHGTIYETQRHLNIS